MATTPGRMIKACQDIFGEDAETCVPRLMDELRTPYLVGVTLGVYANSVRAWLLNRGWTVQDGKWVKPTPVVEGENV